MQGREKESKKIIIIIINNGKTLKDLTPPYILHTIKKKECFKPFTYNMRKELIQSSIPSMYQLQIIFLFYKPQIEEENANTDIRKYYNYDMINHLLHLSSKKIYLQI